MLEKVRIYPRAEGDEGSAGSHTQKWKGEYVNKEISHMRSRKRFQGRVEHRRIGTGGNKS